MVVNMGDILESFLRVAMVVFIVGPLTAWVARRGARERSEATDSLDRFTVRMPAAIRTIIACCAVAFELLMLGVYVWQGVSLGEWDHGTCVVRSRHGARGHGHLGPAEHPAHRRGR